MTDICMTVLTDGRRKYIKKALPTWIEAYDDQIEKKFIIDDSGDPRYRRWLAKKFPSFIIIPVAEERAGYAEAMRKVFSVVLESGAAYCLHIEDDFVLLQPFVLQDVVQVLSQFDRLAQISFMRQPWYANEIEHGGVIEALEANGGAFTQRATGGRPWVVHRSFWTCNPSIFPAWVAARWWPDPPWCEMYFGKLLKGDRKVFGIWGDRKSSDWILTEHIGRKRNGTNY